MDLSTQEDEIEANDQIQISSNGKPCIFPFKYGQQSYTACTLTDSETDIPWCATGLDEDGFVVDWRECIENTEDDQEATSHAYENIPSKNVNSQIVDKDGRVLKLKLNTDTEDDIYTDIEDETDTNTEDKIDISKEMQEDGVKVKVQIQISSNGKPCAFPFKYKGELLSGCTRTDSYKGVPWCTTVSDIEGYVVDEDWEGC